MRPITRAARRRYPAPPVVYTGGVRERLFYPVTSPGPLTRLVLDRLYAIDGPVNAGPVRALLQRVARPLGGLALQARLNLTKLGLIRWQAGLRFNGGAHKVTRAIPISESRAVFLHYPFTRGREGLEYIADRGQHAQGGSYYARMLARDEVLAVSPAGAGSARYTGPASLGALLREVP
ncbi:MAG: hypothetical protein ACLFRU_04360 [Paracoccaceae bacterium]